MKYILILAVLIFLLIIVVQAVIYKKTIDKLKKDSRNDLILFSEQLEDMRHFKHDFKNMAFNLKMLIENNEYEKAKEFLDSMTESFEQISGNLIKYSDNPVIDAVLQKLSAKCRKDGIKFDAAVIVGNNLPLSLLNTSSVFSNLADNAYEAVKRQNNGEKFISFNSSLREKWLTISVTNSFDGKLAYSGSDIKTSKKDKNSHGLGLKSIQKTINSIDGAIFKAEPDMEEKVFVASVIFPR